jgi:MFS family permease
MSLLVNLVAAFYIDSFGRRPILLASTIGMLTCFTIWTILSARYAIEENPSKGLGRGVVALIYMYNFCYNFKTGLPLTYTTEIMPYGLRAKAAIVGAFTTMAAVFANQFMKYVLSPSTASPFLPPSP